jgi:hypothetical protein
MTVGPWSNRNTIPRTCFPCIFFSGFRHSIILLFLLPVFAVAQFSPQVPKVWDDEALKHFELPLAGLGQPPTHISSDYYYRIPATRIHKTYPVYAPDREPPGYLAWLAQHEPENAVDFSSLKTKEDWIRAGEAVFNAPFRADGGRSALEWRRFSATALYPRASRDGTYPWVRYWVAKKGDVRAFFTICGSCHTRVLGDGTVVPGAQGNMNERIFHVEDLAAGRFSLTEWRSRAIHEHSTPWLRPDPAAAYRSYTLEDAVEAERGIVPGTWARTGTNYNFPPKMPDLIGVENRAYLDATGLVRHRAIGDLMRYAALVDGIEQLSVYGDVRPIGDLPDPKALVRMSDEALYALALYIYSLPPPRNPNPFNTAAKGGQKIFQREGCGVCHPAPLYTNNLLIPAGEFTSPKQPGLELSILGHAIGVDPRLAIETRKGTGYYRVPSLKGVWYRGPFEHNGSIDSLEDWFNPERLREEYVPTGFKGSGRTRAVRGHEFGLKIKPEEKAALIAFLRTL